MNNYFKVLNEKLNKRFGNSNLLEDNEVELELVSINMKDVEKRFLELFALALYGSSRVVGNVVYHIEEEFYNRENNFIRKGLYAIYEYIPEDNNLFKIVEFKVKEGKEEETHLIGKQPFSYFTDGIVDTYRSFSEVIDSVNARGDNWFWNGFSSKEQEQEFRELLAIIEPKTFLKEEESQDDEVILEPMTVADITEGSTKMTSDGKWEVWKPNSENAMVNLSQGTKWLSGSQWMARDRGYDEISEESWDLKNWDKALVIINKNKIENKFLFQRGWGGMYSPSFARYSMATWLIKQNSPSLLKWFSEQKLPYVSKRLKARLDVEKVEKSGGVYNYPEGGELPWSDREAVTKIIIAPGTTKIKSRAFSNFRNVKEIDLPDTITSVGEFSFGSMESLESIKLPSNLKKIGNHAFYACLSLRQVIIPNGVTEIGHSAFGSCESLETLFIPNSVTKVLTIVESWARQLPVLLTIYCEAKERPAGWDEDFNVILSGDRNWNMGTQEWTTEGSTYAKVVWGASRPSVSESVEDGELEAIDIKEDVLYEDERWKAFRPLNLAALIEFSNDTDLIDSIRFRNWSVFDSTPFGANSPLLNNFDEFKEEAYFFHDKERNLKYMYLPKEWGWNLVYKGMEKNIMSKWYDMKDFIKLLSITPGFKQFIITKFPHVKPQQFFEEVEDEVDLVGDPEVVFNLHASSGVYVRPTADEKKFITKAIIDKSLTNIQSNTFFGCSNLKEVVFHDGITHIDDLAFAECEKLELTKLPPQLIRIGGEAFRNCKSIKEITIPATVQYIGSGAFVGTDSLKKFHMEDPSLISNLSARSSWHWADGLYWHKLDINFPNPNLKENIRLEEEDASDLLSTDTPDLEVIDDKKILYKDEEWEVVRPITFGAMIDLAGGTNWFDNDWYRQPEREEDFQNSKGQVYYFIINKKNPKVKFLMSPRNFGRDRIKYSDDTGATSVSRFLNNVKTTRGLQNWFKKTFKGLKWDVERHQQREDELNKINYTYIYPETQMQSWGYESLVEKVIIKEGTESIKDGAFIGFKKVKEIKIPSSVKTIGKSAFRSCHSLESIEIPEGVTKIEKETFWGCGKLKSVILPKSLKEIGNQAFWSCDNLETIELPQGLTTIENAAFLGCHTLSNVFIPISVTTIGSQAFELRNSFHNQTPAVIMCEAPEKPSGWDDKWTDEEKYVEVKWNVSK